MKCDTKVRLFSDLGKFTKKYNLNYVVLCWNKLFDGGFIFRLSITSFGRDFCFARHNQSKTLLLLSLIAKIFRFVQDFCFARQLK